MLSKTLKATLLLSVLSVPLNIAHADERVFFDVNSPANNTAQKPSASAGDGNNIYHQDMMRKNNMPSKVVTRSAPKRQTQRQAIPSQPATQNNAAYNIIEQARTRPQVTNQNQNYRQAAPRPEMVVIDTVTQSPTARPRVAERQIYKPVVPAQNGTRMENNMRVENYGRSAYKPAPKIALQPIPALQPIRQPRSEMVVVEPTQQAMGRERVLVSPQPTQAIATKQASAERSYIPSILKKDTKPNTALRARGELNHRYSNDRAITMVELWAPLKQNAENDSVVYGDLRVMGDNNDNEEYNVGVGYRQVVKTAMVGEGVAGANIWYDKRNTARGSRFHQVTTGAEWLGKTNDMRVNAYLPLNKSEIQTQANPNGTQAGFVGTQIVVNTDQTVREEALPGFDVEFGHRIGFLDNITDATRVYAGGFHFMGDQTDDVTGWRARIASDITRDIQLGARYQDDDVRGAQTYLEATVRFPFSAKKSFREDGVRSRLDESPERDIDIVNNDIILDDGVGQTVINRATGLAQEVIHVDNTAGGGGDGSIATPYNTLAAAEAAANPNDIIYVNAGDGLSTGQNLGVALDDAGQMLAGSGAALLFDNTRFTTSNGNSLSGDITIAQATTAPILTNGAGNGIDITADGVIVQGLTVDGATSNGIVANNVSNVSILDVTSQNNTGSGINFSVNGSSVSNLTVSRNTLNNNGVSGVFALAANAFTLDGITLNQNSVVGNGVDGISIASEGGSTITRATISDNTLDTNTSGASVLAETGGEINNLIFNNNITQNNTSNGMNILARSTGQITQADFSNNQALNNNDTGFNIVSQDAGTEISSLNLTDNVSNNSTTGAGYGITVESGSVITAANLTSNTADNNDDSGFILTSTGAGSEVTRVDFDNNTSTNSVTGRGFEASALLAGEIDSLNYFGNDASDNNGSGYFATATGASTINTASYLANTSDDNGGNGFELVVDGAGSEMTSVGYSINAADMNTGDGFSAQVTNNGLITGLGYSLNIGDNSGGNGFSTNVESGGVISDAEFVINFADENTGSGFFTDVSDAGSDITSITYDSNFARENTENGIRARARLDADITELIMQGNTATENTINGVRIEDESAAGGIVADLGGGASSSTGQNNISGNTSEQIYVDLDGAELKAESNFWGDTSGLLGGEVDLQDASTIDSDPFLTSAP